MTPTAARELALEAEQTLSPPCDLDYCEADLVRRMADALRELAGEVERLTPKPAAELPTETVQAMRDYETAMAEAVPQIVEDVRRRQQLAAELPNTPLSESKPEYETGNTTDRNNPGLRKIKPDGQQESYLILSDDERAKGFVRPVRCSYVHLKCGTVTRMGLKIAETYARDPKFYSGTFCCACGRHFNLIDDLGNRAFQWDKSDPPSYVGE